MRVLIRFNHKSTSPEVYVSVTHPIVNEIIRHISEVTQTWKLDVKTRGQKAKAFCREGWKWST